MSRFDLAARAVRRAPLLLQAMRGSGGERPDAEHLGAALGWLLAAQRAGGGGFAHSFHLLDGWRPPYPETTGYILTSLLALCRRVATPALMPAIAAAARWLHQVQQPDGSFLDLSGRPQVFDTGQILGGLVRLAAAEPGLVARDSLARAARWLAAAQEPDGSFVRHAYNGVAHSYYARVGAALLAAGRMLADDGLREAGLRNLRWTIAQQQENGFFRHLSFDAAPPLLHTMIYVVEGLLDASEEGGGAECLAAALRFTAPLLDVSRRRDRLLRARYRTDFAAADASLCLPGLAQWGGVCYRLAARGLASYREEGRRTVAALKRRQLFCREPRLHGGMFGSAPFWGPYMRLAIPNWGVKFLIDAVLAKIEAETPEPHGGGAGAA